MTPSIIICHQPNKILALNTMFLSTKGCLLMTLMPRLFLTPYLTFHLGWKTKPGQLTSLKAKPQMVLPLSDMTHNYSRSWLLLSNFRHRIWRSQRSETKFGLHVACWSRCSEMDRFKILLKILPRQAVCLHYCFNCFDMSKSRRINKKFQRLPVTFWIVSPKLARCFTLSR